MWVVVKMRWFVLLVICQFSSGFENNNNESPDYILIDDVQSVNYKNNKHSETISHYIADDNRKPYFRNCETYNPSVKEEQRIGTDVIRVEAFDPDERDTIEYGLVTGYNNQNHFKIDSKSGQITTAKIFDRDEPARELEEYITVRATDNGRPPLDDVCTFKVIIEDINDNPPLFQKSKYEELVPKDFQAGNKVMRISALDLDDGNNSIVVYSFAGSQGDYDYFNINRENGIISLAKTIDRNPGDLYRITVNASNIVEEPQSAQVDVKIKVIESDKKPPIFINPPHEPIYLKENLSDYQTPIATLVAISNVPSNEKVIFELQTGRTEQTNSKKTFVFKQEGGNSVSVLLGKPLDYEAITEYSITMIARNVYELIAEHVIKIKLEDVNDNIPFFTEVDGGQIPENEQPETSVMQVRAFDTDGTRANNIVSFQLSDDASQYFEIDKDTGIIYSKVQFDREERESYDVKVIATDNSPSALFSTNEPNRQVQLFRIKIADKNDHPPWFVKKVYVVDKMPEDANINVPVIEVTAKDNDTASLITYTIVSGNIGEAFKIEESTGKISIQNKLDYEIITNYTLEIRAFDGIYDDHAQVIINVENVNDLRPEFFPSSYNTSMEEESYDPNKCVVTIRAYDPDITDRKAPQNIRYTVGKKELDELIELDDSGCMKLKKPLDRDHPNGHKEWQILVTATDDSGRGLASTTTVYITLTDINDNAPFLINIMPIIWYENQPPGDIVELRALDYDEPQNGPPFRFNIDSSADEIIKQKFQINNYTLKAVESFDREEQKEYFIPILISDSGHPRRQENISMLHLIIGDVNDNPMKPGESTIFIYNYKGEAPNTDIGRVYVDDPDDWDLADKYFSWAPGNKDTNFELDSNSGMITMRESTPEDTFKLIFTVIEESPLIERHSVNAIVNVVVKYIPEEAVDKSGSIRFYGMSAEEFVTPPSNSNDQLSYKDKFRNSLAAMLNVSQENVDVFTVIKKDQNYLDVRYSAHGSPYYEAVKLNGMVSQHQLKLEQELDVKMYMISIDECIIEQSKCSETSCANVLHKSNIPIYVYTNRTSFVGVNAFTQAECVCKVPITEIKCLNGGTRFDEICECPEGYDGPYCEDVSIGFQGNGYALYPSINPCDSSNISIQISPMIAESGLILYIGPMAYNPILDVQDFLALELVNGYPVLTVDYGTGSVRIEHKHIQIQPDRTYIIDILLSKSGIEMTVDNCRLSTCMSLGAPQGPNKYLNVNSPIHVGGTSVNLNGLASSYNWTHTPTSRGFTGCIKRLTIDGTTYNLGQPALALNANSCNKLVATAVSFGIDSNFLIAIIVCVIVLMILLLAIVVTKKRQDDWHEKDMDDIRETIINYEDEGGGERDTEYDLNVLRAPPIYEDRPYRELRNHQQDPHEVPDIGGFLVDKKDTCDRDNDAHPLDDVRHYAYEGDGNSTGSLSSLASCTDDGDLKFDYLSSFGPRFRKLADMYGEEPSDVDSNVDGDEGWRI